jgi:hypothetical protein
LPHAVQSKPPPQARTAIGANWLRRLEKSSDPRADGRTSLNPLGGRLRLIAIVPVAALSVGIRPIPAEVGSRARRDGSDRGDRDQGPERDARNDGAIIGPPNPRPGIPIRPSSPARRTTPGTPPSRSPAPTREELDLLNGAMSVERLGEPSALAARGTKPKQAGGQ